eukprot:6183838-Pleurochrysis_carterae.AAC.4
MQCYVSPQTSSSQAVKLSRGVKMVATAAGAGIPHTRRQASAARRVEYRHGSRASPALPAPRTWQ